MQGKWRFGSHRRVTAKSFIFLHGSNPSNSSTFTACHSPKTARHYTPPGTHVPAAPTYAIQLSFGATPIFSRHSRHISSKTRRIGKPLRKRGRTLPRVGMILWASKFTGDRTTCRELRCANAVTLTAILCLDGCSKVKISKKRRHSSTTGWKKIFQWSKNLKTVHCGSVWPPPVHVFKTPNGFFFKVKLDKLQAKTYFFSLTFWPRIGCFEGGNRSPIVWFEISCQTPSMGTEFRHTIPMVSTTAQGPLDWRWWLFAIGFQRRSCAKCHLDLDQLTLYTYILVHTCDTGQTRGKKPLEVCRSCCVAVLGRDQTPTR